MNNFEHLPMDIQIERITELAYEALKQWDISPESIELIKYRENAVFKVLTQDGNQFALRLHRPGYHDDVELRSELQWISALENSGVDVPSVIPAANGQLLINTEVSSVPQARQADLFAWVNGDQLGSLEE
ncbi:MAG: phosphotransferase, partial [Oceanospirillaceae bacterium]|nr:phosphotransferase [Oceanospirillaceae bacterium]